MNCLRKIVNYTTKYFRNYIREGFEVFVYDFMTDDEFFTTNKEERKQ